jgi:hypothetical protein
MDRLPHCPDLAPSDFHLFGPLKEHLAAKRNATDGDFHCAVISWLKALDADFCRMLW